VDWLTSTSTHHFSFREKVHANEWGCKESIMVGTVGKYWHFTTHVVSFHYKKNMFEPCTE